MMLSLLVATLPLLGRALPAPTVHAPPTAGGWTDGQPQPRGPRWAPGLPEPPAAVDPHIHGADGGLPAIARLGLNTSADDGLARNATPQVSVVGDSLYTFGVAATTRYVYSAPYATHVVRRWDTVTGERVDLAQKSEFVGLGGNFAIAAAPDDTVFLGVDGNGCMPGNVASKGARCGLVRRIATDGSERVVVQNLTTPKQLALDRLGRLYITEEWRHRIVRYDPRSPAHDSLEVVVQPNETATVEGVAVSSSFDIYFSEYGVCGGDADDPAGRGQVEGVALAAGVVKVKRAGTGAVERLAEGFWRCRGLALHESSGVLYIANEANAWDQASSGAIHALDIATGKVTRVLQGLDYPQFPAVDPSGRLFVSLAIHNKVVMYDPSSMGDFATAVGDDALSESGVVVSARGGASWAPMVVSARLQPARSRHVSLVLRLPGLQLGPAATGDLLSGFLSLPVAPPTTAAAAGYWVRVPRDRFPALYKDELPYNDAFVPSPDNFDLPAAECALVCPVSPSSDEADLCGGTCTVSAQVSHRHNGSRWPMLQYTLPTPFQFAGRLFPSDGWDASPESYLFFVSVRGRAPIPSAGQLTTDDAAPRRCANVTKDGLCCNPGALNVGPILHVSNLTLSAASKWCNASSACAGFTAKVNPNHSKSIGEQCLDSDSATVYKVYFKTMLGGNADSLWSSWRKIGHVAPTFVCHKHRCQPCQIPGLEPCRANISYTQPDCFGQCNSTSPMATLKSDDGQIAVHMEEVPRAAAAQQHPSVNPACVDQATAVCNAHSTCKAFGIDGDSIQLHGCNSTTRGPNWVTYAKRPGVEPPTYTRSDGLNVDEAKCSHHVNVHVPKCTAPGPGPAPSPPSPPSHWTPHYTNRGAFAMETLETSLFFWRGTGARRGMYAMESMGCHRGAATVPDGFANHSYFRVRDLHSGEIVANIAASIGFGFGSSFVDYDHETLWIFGTRHDRCANGGLKKACDTDPNSQECLAQQGVWSWSSSDLVTWTQHKTDVVWPDKCKVDCDLKTLAGNSTSNFNVDVARVRMASGNASPGVQMLPHKYVMVTNTGNLMVNNEADGNLTRGWYTMPVGTGWFGCPSIQFLPSDGYYYVVQGGKDVTITRSQTLFQADSGECMRGGGPFIQPSPADGQVAPFANFSESVASSNVTSVMLANLRQANFSARQWDFDSNDADICCESWGGAAEVTSAYINWGISSQGQGAKGDLRGGPTVFQGIGTANVTLDKLLQSYFVSADDGLPVDRNSVEPG